MAEVTRRAEVHWKGDLKRGGGTIDLASSGAASAMDFSLPTRAAERAGGQTSPEELLAAAHVSCYAMSVSAALTARGHRRRRWRRAR